MRKVLLLIIMFAIGMMTKAGDVTEQQALNKAQQFFNSHQKVQRTRGIFPAKTVITPKLVYIGTTANTSGESAQTSSNSKVRKSAAGDESQDQPCFYVFNSGDNSGFVIPKIRR